MELTGIKGRTRDRDGTVHAERKKKADDLRYQKVTDLFGPRERGELVGSLIHARIISSKVNFDVDRKIESYVLLFHFSDFRCENTIHIDLYAGRWCQIS
jgi:hypothetical protein